MPIQYDDRYIVKPGRQIQFTAHMLQELARCANDIIYFAEKYFYIVNIDEGKHKIKLFEYQKKALKVFTSPSTNGKKNTIILTPRQMGKCFFRDTILKIRNKKTGEIQEISSYDLYMMVYTDR